MKKRTLFWVMGLLLMAVVVGMFVLLYWQTWLQQTIVWQRALNRSLSSLMQEVAAHRNAAGGMLVLVSFLYGLLHAMGPGHGKVIITTYIATHPTQLKRSVTLTLLASLLQGVVAIVLTFTVLSLLQLSTRQVHLSGVWLEKISYLLIALFGLVLLIKSLQRLRSRTIATTPAIKYSAPRAALSPSLTPSRLTIKRLQPMDASTHSAECGCGHQHVVDNEMLSKAWKSQMLVVFAMGFRPCSGALLMLILSYVMGIFYWGMLSAMAMAMGTALTITCIAMIVYFMRQTAVNLLVFQRARWLAQGLIYLQLLAGLLLILMGVLLYQSLDVSTSTSISPLLR